MLDRRKAYAFDGKRERKGDREDVQRRNVSSDLDCGRDVLGRLSCKTRLVD